MDILWEYYCFTVVKHSMPLPVIHLMFSFLVVCTYIFEWRLRRMPVVRRNTVFYT